MTAVVNDDGKAAAEFAYVQTRNAGAFHGFDVHSAHQVFIAVLDLAKDGKTIPKADVGAMSQMYAIVQSDMPLTEKNEKMRALLSMHSLHYETSSMSAMAGWEQHRNDFPSIKEVKSSLTLAYIRKSLPFDSLVALVATCCHPVIVNQIMASRAHTGSWSHFAADFGFDRAEMLKELEAAVPTLKTAYGHVAGESVNDWCPVNVIKGSATTTAATTTATTATTINTQGVTTMNQAAIASAVATATASINPAVKGMLEKMLADAGVTVTIDKMYESVMAADAMKQQLEASAKAHEAELDQMRAVIANAKAAAPMNLTTQGNGAIPGGKMDMVQAETIFPQLAGVKLEIPLFTWDHAHPDVPATDDNYIFRKEMLIKALRCLVRNENLWLRGHTGSGKTTFIEQIAARLQWPVARVAFDSNVDRSELVGRMQLEGDGKGGTTSKWLAGILERATTTSMGYIMLTDEVDAGHPNALYVLQPLLEGKPLTLLEDGGRIVDRKAMTRIVATGNTAGNGDPSGLYPACRILSAATTDRFANYINVPYLSLDEEIELIRRQVPGLKKVLVTKLAKFAGEMRQAFVQGQIPVSYSPRKSIAFAREVFDLNAMGFTDEGAVLTAAFRSKLYDASSEEFQQRLTEIANASLGNIDPTRELS